MVESGKRGMINPANGNLVINHYGKVFEMEMKAVAINLCGYDYVGVIDISEYTGLIVDMKFSPESEIYIAFDYPDCIVGRYDFTGTKTGTVGNGAGCAGGESSTMYSIETTTDQIYVWDYNRGACFAYDPTHDPRVNQFRMSDKTELGNFWDLTHITSNGFMAADYTNNKIYISLGGQNTVVVTDLNGGYITAFGSAGSGNGEFSGNANILIYNSEIYVNDYGNNRIQIFNLAGVYQKQIAHSGVYVGGIFVFNDGITDLLFVVDSSESKIYQYDLDGNLLQTCGIAGTGEGQLNSPYGILLQDDYLYIQDVDADSKQRVQIFQKTV